MSRANDAAPSAPIDEAPAPEPGLARVEPPPSAPESAPPSSVPLPGDGPRTGPPSSFARIFLNTLDRYQKTPGAQRHIGSAIEEAAGYIAQETAPLDKRANRAVLKLRSPRAVFESVVLTLVVPALGFAFHRDDPFFLTEGFSWLLFTPLLLGLRHGFAPAVGSALATASMMLLAWRLDRLGFEALPGGTLLGLFIVAMISGQFSDVWKREIVRLDGAFNVARRQLNELSRAHFLLELSYDKLLDAQGRGVPNLRDAIAQVRKLSSDGRRVSMGTMAEPILEVMASYCMLETASIYPVKRDAIGPKPSALMGGTQGLARLDDMLLLEALRTKQVTTLVAAGRKDPGAAGKTGCLAAIPFVDTAGKVHGLLAVEAMPFIAFDRKNLETLFMLGGHFADILSTRGEDTNLERGRRYEFEVRMNRALRDLRDFELPCTIFGLLMQRGSAINEIIEVVLGSALRVLDFPLVLRDAEGNYAVYILLPMTTEENAQILGERLSQMVEEELDTTMFLAGAYQFFHGLKKEETVEEVMGLLLRKARLNHATLEHTIAV